MVLVMFNLLCSFTGKYLEVSYVVECASGFVGYLIVLF